MQVIHYSTAEELPYNGLDDDCDPATLDDDLDQDGFLLSPMTVMILIQI